MIVAHAIQTVLAQFAIAGRVEEARPFCGHINDSYVVTCADATGRRRYLLQRINEHVFRRPLEVMENIERVTRHIERKAAAGNACARNDNDDAGARIPSRTPSRGNPFPQSQMLTLIFACNGRCFHQDAVGGTWRLYHFIENSRVVESAQTPAQAEAAARAFGEFQGLLADFEGPRLHETIVGFHDTPSRYASLDAVLGGCDSSRSAAARAEIESAQRHRLLASVLLDLHRDGAIPERIVHNDAKISNVLFDESTDEALCVVDLDTVMPGLSLYDFGDMVRSMATTAAEDEPDPSKVEVELPLFEGLARGYLSAAGGFLNATEREHLVTAGKLITLEQAVRFLTDYLAGDVYYKTTRPGQNLDRASAQFKLLETIERNEQEMRAVVDAISR